MKQVFLIVTIPVIPKNAPVFDLFHVKPDIVPLSKTQIFSIKLDNEFLAIDHEHHMLHLPLSLADLNSCEKFEDMYLCEHKRLHRKPMTCVAALVYGHKCWEKIYAMAKWKANKCCFNP